MSCAGANAKNSGGDDRHQREQPEVADQEQQSDAGAGADPGVAAERRRASAATSAGMTSAAQSAILRAEQYARRGDAGDQHQLAEYVMYMPSEPCGRCPR